MKKLILVLVAVAITAFLLVGCTPGVTPVTPIAGIDCPTTVVVEGEVLIGGKNYIKGEEELAITVTFAVPTAPISVYVGSGIESKAIPTDADEVVMYTTDNKVYTGTYTFDENAPYDVCSTDYIYVETCGTCSACKYPYTVDDDAPYASIQICAGNCEALCGGCDLTFTSTVGAACDVLTEHCGDDCAGFATWDISIYDEPLGDCCTTACGGKLIDSMAGTACPIDWTTDCLAVGDDDHVVYAYVTLTDKVGNSTIFGYQITQDWDVDTCETVTVVDIVPGANQDCLDYNPHVACPVCVNVIPVD